VIARTWHGRVPTGKADAYQSFLERVAVPDYESTPGNRGVLLLRRADGDLTHFVFVTLWDSIEAIRRYAGEDPERARYYPEDDDFLLEKEELVTHAEVVLTR
jgi:heme-degrading monooxygenase HmoA